MTESGGHRGRLRELRNSSTERCARLWTSTTERVNFRTAAEVLAWLAAVVAFALLFPLWLTVSVAATALAVGAIRAAEHTVRAALILVPVVGGVVGATYLLSRHPAGAHEPRVRKWVSVGYGLQAALEVKNLTFRNRWGTTIEADGHDELEIRLMVRNANATAAPPSVARLYVGKGDEPGDGPRTISYSFALNPSGPFTPGPQVSVIAQSNGLYTFHAIPLRYGEPAATTPYGEGSYTTPKAELVGSLPRPRGLEREENTGEEYAIPSLPAHGQLVMSFTGYYQIPADSQLGAGDVLRIKNPRGPGHRYATTASAVPGDTLSVWGIFHNDGFQGAFVNARIRIRSEEKGTVGLVTLYAREDEGRYRKLGSALVNSGNGAPIKLIVQPGSTELIAPKTDCSKGTTEALPDGISESGVDIGVVGDWVPRDPCHGREFGRYVLFNVDVK